MAAFLSSLSIGLAIGAAALVVSSCALLAPLPKQKDVAERLAAFPTRGLPLEGARDDPLERAADSLHRSRQRRRRGVRARPRARAFAARPDGDDAHDRAGARVGDDRPARRRHRPRPAHPRLRPCCSGDRAGLGRGHAAVGPALRGRRQPLPGDNERSAARLRSPRPGARALDAGGRVRHGAPRRHGRELAGLGGPAPAARTGRLGRALGAPDDGRNGVAIEFRG